MSEETRSTRHGCVVFATIMALALGGIWHGIVTGLVFAMFTVIITSSAFNDGYERHQKDIETDTEDPYEEDDPFA